MSEDTYLGPYLLGPNNTKWQGIYTGDNRTLMQYIPDASVNLIVTSPPYDGLRKYNGKWSFDFEALAAHAYRILKPGGVMVWVVSDSVEGGSETLTTMRQAIHFVDICGFKMHDTMIWEKSKGTNPNTALNPTRYHCCFEYMLVLSKDGPAKANLLTEPTTSTGRKRNPAQRQRNGENVNYSADYEYNKSATLGNVWHIHVGWMHTTLDKEAFAHPAMFPEKLAERHILTWSNPGDVVVDFFMGAGTTAKMCKLHGRRWWGCDVSQEYVELARNRVRNTMQPLFVMPAPEMPIGAQVPMAI